MYLVLVSHQFHGMMLSFSDNSFWFTKFQKFRQEVRYNRSDFFRRSLSSLSSLLEKYHAYHICLNLSLLITSYIFFFYIPIFVSCICTNLSHQKMKPEHSFSNLPDLHPSTLQILINSLTTCITHFELSAITKLRL